MKIENLQALTTKRLILRPFISEDFTALHELLSDEKVNRFLPWFVHHNIEMTRNFMEENILRSYREGSGYHYAIYFKEDNYPIGYVHVSNDDSRDLGYALAKKYWHQGITSEACLAFIDYLRACGFSYLTATHDVENPNSGRVMQKCSFHYCYSYQEQWQPKDKMVYFRMYQLNFKKDAEMFMGYWNRYPYFIETIE